MVKNQKYIDYYENGNKKSEGKIKIVRFKSRGSYEGPSKSDLDDWDIDQRHSFYEGGGRDNDRYHSTIENNLTFMNDLWKYYYENGNIKCEGKFKDGILKSKYKDKFGIHTKKRFGEWKFYDENHGKLIEIINYVKIFNDTVKSGIYKRWNYEEKYVVEFLYENNIKIGKCTKKDFNSKIIETGWFRDNKYYKGEIGLSDEIVNYYKDSKHIFSQGRYLKNTKLQSGRWYYYIYLSNEEIDFGKYSVNVTYEVIKEGSKKVSVKDGKMFIYDKSSREVLIYDSFTKLKNGSGLLGNVYFYKYDKEGKKYLRMKCLFDGNSTYGKENWYDKDGTTLDGYSDGTLYLDYSDFHIPFIQSYSYTLDEKGDLDINELFKRIKNKE